MVSTRSFVRRRRLEVLMQGWQPTYSLFKGQARGVDLSRQILGVEHLGIRDHQQVKRGFLTVTKKKIFADDRLQRFVNFLADFHRHGRGMVNAVIFDPKTIQ